MVKDPTGQQTLVSAIKDAFKSHAKVLSQEVSNFQTLQDIIRPWHHYDFVTKTPVPAILSFMDDINKKTGPSFYQMGLMSLADEVFLIPAIADRLRPMLWDIVRSTRAGNPPEPHMKHMLSILLSVSHTSAERKPFYADYFENAMVEDACAVHKPFVTAWAAESTCAYLEQAAAKVEAELQHTQMFLPEVSRRRLRTSLETTLMDAPENDGLRGLLTRQNGGLIPLLATIPVDHPESSTETLATIRSIFRVALCRENCCEIVCDLLGGQFKADAKLITDNPELKGTAKTSYIAPLLQAKHKYETIVHEAFGDYKPVKDYMDGVFPSIVRALPAEEVASSLAVHYNILIKTAGTKDAQLQQAICVLQYLTDKDIFENCHRKHMKRRLLMSESSEDQLELENSLINFIKLHYDTSTMEMMFHDYQRALTERATWQAYAETLPSPLTLTFRPLVLNTNRWSQEPLGLILPPVLQQCLDTYTAWYCSVHTSRKLNWIGMGTAEVGYKCGRSYKLVLDTTPQLIYILQFDGIDTLTADVIAANTGSTADAVHRFLAPFASKQIAVLNKTGDSYSLNPKFKPAKNVLKVPMGARAQATEDKSKTASEISVQRKAMTQAAIVRMMKSFKSLKHNDLIARVMEELQKRFKPDPKDIKKEIAFLIQETYLKRSEASLDTYEYVA
jgi:hypothetical protein